MLGLLIRQKIASGLAFNLFMYFDFNIDKESYYPQKCGKNDVITFMDMFVVLQENTPYLHANFNSVSHGNFVKLSCFISDKCPVHYLTFI